MERALDLYTRCLPLVSTLDEGKMEGDLLRHWGTLHHEQGRLEEAFSYYSRALAIHRKAKNRRGEAQALDNLGYVLFEQGKMGEARRVF